MLMMLLGVFDWLSEIIASYQFIYPCFKYWIPGDGQRKWFWRECGNAWVYFKVNKVRQPSV